MSNSPKELLKLPAAGDQIDLPDVDGTILPRGNTFTITMALARPIDLSALEVYVNGNDAHDQAVVSSCTQALNVVIQHGLMLDYPNRGGRSSSLLLIRRRLKPRDSWRCGKDITPHFEDANGREPQRKILGLSTTSAQLSTFECEGRTTNVAEYFREHRETTLAHPDWPCVRVSRVALWPIEVVEILPGNKYTRKLDPEQTAASLALTTIKPAERVPHLRKGIEMMISSTNQGSGMKQWGLAIDKNLMQVDARILPAPAISYQKSNKFYQPCKPIENWSFFSSLTVPSFDNGY